MEADNSRLTSAKELGRGYHDLGGLGWRTDRYRRYAGEALGPAFWSCTRTAGLIPTQRMWRGVSP
jgi:hypothetical protein